MFGIRIQSICLIPNIEKADFWHQLVTLAFVHTCIFKTHSKTMWRSPRFNRNGTFIVAELVTVIKHETEPVDTQPRFGPP